MTPRPRPAIACAAALTAAAIWTACGLAREPASAPKSPTSPSRTASAAAPPPALSGEAARVGKAVRALGRALVNGDVERLCRPGAIFTAAVVDEMGNGGVSCEASVEDTLAAPGPPVTTVVGVSVEQGLATARVRVRAGRTVPLTLVRDRRRWLVSFSDGNDPLSALTT